MGKKRPLRQAAAFCFLALISGCMPLHFKSESRAPLDFPPQAAMQSGDYKGFLTRNSAALKSCSATDECAVPLFNLAFLYCYPRSPYYDPPRALRFLSALIARAPKSSWAAEAMVWRELVLKEMKEKSRFRRIASQNLKTKQADLQNKASMEKNWQVDRQVLQDEINSKDQIIKELDRQLKGSRKIDIEMEKKEKRLQH